MVDLEWSWKENSRDSAIGRENPQDVGGETDKEPELNGKDIFLKHNKGKTYGTDLGGKTEEPKITDILSPGNNKEEWFDC